MQTGFSNLFVFGAHNWTHGCDVNVVKTTLNGGNNNFKETTSRKLQTRLQRHSVIPSVLGVTLKLKSLLTTDVIFYNTGRERLIRSHSSARFSFELSGNSN